MKDAENPEKHIALFKGKSIRKTIYQWWFSVVDVIEALTDSPTPRQYWGKVKQREFIDLKLSPIWVQLKLESSDGKEVSVAGTSNPDGSINAQSIQLRPNFATSTPR